jgi:hypothetical protein
MKAIGYTDAQFGLPISDARAHALIESGTACGKIVLKGWK